METEAKQYFWEQKNASDEVFVPLEGELGDFEVPIKTSHFPNLTKHDT